MKKILSTGVSIVLSALLLFPILNVFTFSLMSDAEIMYFQEVEETLHLIPLEIKFEGYFNLLFATNNYLRLFWNSMLITSACAVANILNSILLSYIFVHLNFKGRKFLIWVFIYTMLLPYQATMLPNYLLTKYVNLHNTWWAVILPMSFSPMTAILLIPFQIQIETDTIDAALLDTKSLVKILHYIVVPYIKPGIICTFIITFAEGWNMVEQPLIMLIDKSLWPLSVALSSQLKPYSTILFSGALLYMMPIVLLYLMFKEDFLCMIGEIVAK